MKMLLTVLLMWSVLTAQLESPARGASDDEALLVIVNAGTHVKFLSRDELEAVFTLSERQWPGGQTIVPFNYAPGTPLRDEFDRSVLRMNADAVARFWIDRRIRGGGDAPRKVPSVLLMLKVIAKLPGAIGYVPASMANTPEVAAVKVVAKVNAGSLRPGSSQ